MTLDYLKNLLRIDFTDDDSYLADLIDIAQIYIDFCVGEAYKTDDKALKLADILLQKFVTDMNTNRSTTISENIKQDRIVTTTLDLLSNYME
ncbi:uncharacterized phage protein (possible DNA packaging) [Clostridium acidisoli DSM 12555]|uniref:Uncharacterized phage protein (Possible DNA packaging) n=1 Tax=Clostridium acidisoli DSM 12555 TaxID=1121291 RepID=A0A1W1X693_9CLOT|nr:head-tail connector protein [Clostridium acidisoli]SMC19333.1 uncharacterized phage protein (possible DNA packaging) [Clostridium acidisoli DSM 12555]